MPDALRLLGSSPWSARFGMLVVLFYVVMAIFAPALTPYGESEIVAAEYEPWSSEFLLGTDNLGRAAQLHPVEHDVAVRQAAAGARVSHRREADGRLAGARLADQPEHLAPVERHVHAMDDLVPLLARLPLDTEPPHPQQGFAGVGVGVGVGGAATHPSIRPFGGGTSRR